MPLKETLQKIKYASRSKLPAETAAIMSRTSERLKESGVDAMALKAGQAAPDFVLSDWQGKQYDSKAIRANGPMILSFYRGSW
jgi:hypothetical protein